MRLTWVVALTLLFTSAAVHADSARTELKIRPGLVAEAEFWPGEAGRPAVMILHGFLATRHFPTVRRLAESLADEGFSVLTPTLTLGLSRRRQSMACEALHTHALEDDIAEIRAWADWLHRHAGRPPVLVGHSAGGVQLAAFLDGHPEVPVERALLISLSYFGEEQGHDRFEFLRARAENDNRQRPTAMLPYALTYCSTYVTTPPNLLSYLAWDKERLQQALLQATVPVEVIYGGRDERIDKDWVQSLRSGGVPVREVPGANHFFDLAHEFDLLDQVLSAFTGERHG
ncbi:MAG: alpha/beta fold hydrolase [Gammaproteobacteria bacterium]|nr:alpha/beta fold hydrolase [Gammaproteobacteria bacterium]